MNARASKTESSNVVSEVTKGPAPQGQAVVTVQQLTKMYDTFTAVDSLSLEVGQGELLCLLGPSGCGKTTTLSMIAGFVQPTRGAIHIAGADVTRLPPYKRDTGMVFQSYALFPHMTVAANVAFGLENSPAESSSEWRWQEPWWEIRGCYSRTSPPAILMNPQQDGFLIYSNDCMSVTGSPRLW